MEIRQPRKGIIELRAGGPDDPHGVQTAAILGAYFQLEQVKAFRRLLWERMAAAALLWLLVALFTLLLSISTVIAGLVLMGTAAFWAAVLEWRAEERLRALIDSAASR